MKGGTTIKESMHIYLYKLIKSIIRGIQIPLTAPATRISPFQNLFHIYPKRNYRKNQGSIQNQFIFKLYTDINWNF